jgi:hypothetical protein
LKHEINVKIYNFESDTMKTLRTLLIVANFIFGFATISFGQVSATATATGIIVTPIGITNAVNMNFGNVAVSSTAGTVVLAPAGTRTSTGGITLPAITGTVTAAQFTVTGAANYSYTITLPTTATTVTSGANSMTVNTFTSTPASGTLSSGGAQTVFVGATLNVGGSQVAGTYLSPTPFTVTVNYN